MAKTKISQLDSLSLVNLQGGDLLVVSRPGVKNYKLPAEEYIPTLANLGGAASVYKETSVNTHNFRTLVESTGIGITTFTNTLNFRVKPEELNLNEFAGILPLSMGGTGTDLTAPVVPSIYYFNSDTELTDWLTIGTGLAIQDGALVSTVEAGTYTASTGLSLTGTAFSVVYGYSAGQSAQGNVEITVDAGAGLSGGGTLYVGQGGTLTLTNNDRGSLQNIIKTIIGDSGSYAADSNTDSFSIVGGSGISTAIVGDVLTITNTAASGSGYDTGWITVASWNGSYGVTHATSLPTGRTFRNRVINRTVYFKGYMLIPIEGLTDMEDITTSADNTPYETSNGVTVFAADNRINIGPIMPNANAYPDQDVTYKTKGYRYTRLATSAETVMMQADVWVKFTADGILQVLSIGHYEAVASPLGTGTQIKNRLERLTTTVVEAGDYPLDFDTYRTAHSGAVLLTDITQGAGTYAMDFNGTDVTYFGGMVIDMDGMYYHCDPSVNVVTLNGYF
jgi:hypothetical protein